MKKNEEFKSSIINEVIKAVLNSFFFMNKAQKALKTLKAFGQKHKNANKGISDYFPLRCFLGVFFIFVRL